MRAAVSPPDTPKSWRGSIWPVLAAVAAAGISCLPIFLPGVIGPGHQLRPSIQHVDRLAALAIPLLAVWFTWAVPSSLSRRDKFVLFVLLALTTWYLIDLHLTYVDAGHYFPTTQFADNTAWQQTLHRKVIAMEAGALPHSYRFLPDAFTALVEWATGSYEFARLIYRATFQWLLVFSIYYFARLYLSHLQSLSMVLIYAAIYPASIRYYAGQLTDPLSHLSFVLAFIFIELDEFLWFLTAVLLGTLAKESVAIVALYPLLFSRGDRRGWLRGVIATVACAIFVVGVRMFVHRLAFGYEDVSGVPPGHLIRNLALLESWPRQAIFTVGVLIPFAAAGWKRGPRRVKELLLLVGPALIVSNAAFSWMHEARNFVPITLLLAVIAVQMVSRLKTPSLLEGSEAEPMR